MRNFTLLSGAAIFLISGASKLHAQSCETFGTYNVGPDVEITCVDSCLTLTAPQVADVAAGGTDYAVEAIDYDPPYAYTLGTVAINTGDDTYAPNIPIGFSFNFYGNNYTTCKIASNGFITFDQGETAPYNPNGSIPAASLPLNAIMAVYSDINPSTCGQIRYTTQGSAPCRKFVVNFDHVCQFSCTSQIVTSQIVLYEGSNAIEVYVDQRIPCSWGNATIGIQNQAGNSGLAAPGYNTGNWNANDVAWRWTSSQPAEGVTFWYEDEVFLGSGPSVDFCTSQTTTVTAEFGILAPGTFCEEYTVTINSAGSLGANNQIGWTLYTENGFPVVSESAPYNNSFCLANGCYTLDMTDSGNNGWGSAAWSLELPDGTTIGPFTIESGGEATETFCLDSYTGPLPEIGDYEIVAEDDLDIIAVSDANAEFDFPGLICENSEPFQLVPVEGSGSWTVDCNGCFDEETLTIDPVAAGFGNLEVTHVLDGTCFADVYTDYVSIGNVPDINFASTTDTSLCAGETFDYNCTPPIGLWAASCGNCINSSGIFFTDISGAGEFEVTFTTFGACPGSGTLIVGVSEEVEATLDVPPLICEDDEVTFSADAPGTWTASCGECIDSETGVFSPAGTPEGTYDIVFTPESFCPIESNATITVSPSVSIGGGNVPASLCVEADEVDFNTNIPGGIWTASCGDCVSDEGLFDPAVAGPGVVALTYSVESGACSDSADFFVDINPVLSGTLDEVPPLCEGSTFNLDFTYDPDIPEEYTTGNSGTWTSTDCPGCITGPVSGNFAANEVGTISVVYTFTSNCSTPIVGTVEVAPAVDATIDAVPQLCETGDVVTLSAAEAGGTWSASCNNCLSGNTFDPTVGAGDYTITYTIDDVCTDQDQILIDVIPQLNATIDLPNVVCIGSETVQAGVFIGGGEWSATINGDPCLTCFTENTAEIDLLAAGVGMLEVTYVLDGLCGDTDVASMEIRGCSVELVNVFTPNEDGINDALVFKNLPYFPGNTLRIFDRWGGLTFEAYNYQNTWRGEGASDGTYFYTLDVPGFDPMHGTITISREPTE